MKTPLRSTAMIRATATKITARLHDRREGEKVSAWLLSDELDVSTSTIHRALRWLRQEINAPLEFDRVEGWKLDPAWHQILEIPSPEEVAVMRTLSALASEGLWGDLAAQTLSRIAIELELRLGERASDPALAARVRLGAASSRAKVHDLENAGAGFVSAELRRHLQALP